MAKKSNKNGIKVNKEKKVVSKKIKSKTKRVLSAKSSMKKEPVAKKETKNSSKSGESQGKPKSKNATPIFSSGALFIPETPKLPPPKITALSPESFQTPATITKPFQTPGIVAKPFQAPAVVTKPKSTTVIKPAPQLPANNTALSKPISIPHTLPPPPQTFLTADIKTINITPKIKPDVVTYNFAQKLYNSSTSHEEDQSKEANKVIAAPISFAKPYPYPLEPSFNYQLYKEFKQVADVAMRFRKTFMIYGAFPAVRRSLRNRGWVEKLPFTAHEALMKLTINELLRKMEGSGAQKELCETVIITKMLGTRKPDFIWNNSTHAKDAHTFDACQILSRMRHEPQGNFTQKYGLNRCLQDYTWHFIPGEAEIKFPRCYNSAIKEQMVAFEEDFLLTACVSLLAYLQTKTCDELVSETGKIGFDTIEFAIAHCNRHLYKSRHLDIDDPIYDNDEDPKDKISQEDINDFLYCYYQIVQHEKTFELDDNKVLEGLKAESSKIYNSIKNMFPQHFIDGYCNMWLIKPGNQSRGRGILVLQTLDEIQDEIKKAPRKYVLQKYIERPLLIYGTKFDIRQYFLLTGTCPLTVWMYQDCYLRFSSRTYDLKNFHQAIHLTNNAIQSHYKNEETRDPNLPKENMWHSSTFQQYLIDHGCPNAWSKLIYPAMRRCIVGTLLAAQEFLDRRNNSFELYGCDFLISEDFTPWLIEINSGPAMSASTNITAKLCPQALEDVIKVVIDYTRNWRAPTGRFELIYRQYIPAPEMPFKDEFLVEGKALPNKYFHNFTYNEMLKIPSFSHLLRNQPRREINEYNELLPYVKEKLLRDRNMALDFPSLQNEKKAEPSKRRRSKTRRDDFAKKPSLIENIQTGAKTTANKPLEVDDPIEKDSSKTPNANKRPAAPEAVTKIIPPKKYKIIHRPRKDDLKLQIKTSCNIDLRETNAKEDLKIKSEEPAKPTVKTAPITQVPEKEKETNNEVKNVKNKVNKTTKNDGSPTNGDKQKSPNTTNENSAIDARKQSVDAVISNKPIQITNRTMSNEAVKPQEKNEKPIKNVKTVKRNDQQKVNNSKVPPAVKALKSLQ